MICQKYFVSYLNLTTLGLFVNMEHFSYLVYPKE